MKISIFELDVDSNLKRKEISTAKFKNQYLVASFGKGKTYYRMQLQDDTHILYDLLVGDVLYVFYNAGEYGKCYPLQQVASFSLDDWGLTLQQKLLIGDVKNAEEQQTARIQEITSYLIEHFSARNSEKFRVLSQAASLGASSPSFLNELKEYFIELNMI